MKGWEPYEGQEQEIADLETQISKSTEEEFNPITDATATLPVDNTYAMINGSRLYCFATSQARLYYNG